MHPLLYSGQHLPIIDLKLKLDNKQSKEINLGLVYRYNVNDKAILGIYSYFDHRYVGKNFSVNGLTSGIEVLSKYFDARANIYIPQEKRKQIVTNKNKNIEINGTSIYVTSGGHKYTTALKGYDIEAGIPLFWFSNFLNDKFGTKIYGARYDFRGKQVRPITGNRFRLEQDIGNIYLGQNSYTFRLETGTQYDKVRKQQNYVGLGLKIAFGDKQNLNRKRSNGLDRRMMETVIRDVDIITEDYQETPTKTPLYMNNREIKHIYYVGSADSSYNGSGLYNNPFSLEQLKNINTDDALIILVPIDYSKGGKNISQNEYNLISSKPGFLNDKEEVVLSSNVGVSLKIVKENGYSIKSEDVNVKVVLPTNTNTLVTKDSVNIIQTQIQHQEAQRVRREELNQQLNGFRELFEQAEEQLLEEQRGRREELNQQPDGIGDLFAEVENHDQVEEERKLAAATKIQALFRGKKARAEVAQQRLDQQLLLVQGEWDTIEQSIKDMLNELVWKGLPANQRNQQVAKIRQFLKDRQELEDKAKDIGLKEQKFNDKLMHAKFKKGQFEELEEQLKIKQKELELKRQKLNNESRVMLLEHTRLKNQLDETNLEEDHEVILLQSKQEKNKMQDHLLEVRTFKEEKKVWRLEYNQLVEEIKTWKLECNQLGEEKKILKLERDQLREEIKLKQLKRIVQK